MLKYSLGSRPIDLPSFATVSDPRDESQRPLLPLFKPTSRQTNFFLELLLLVWLRKPLARSIDFRILRGFARSRWCERAARGRVLY